MFLSLPGAGFTLSSHCRIDNSPPALLFTKISLQQSRNWPVGHKGTSDIWNVKPLLPNITGASAFCCNGDLMSVMKRRMTVYSSEDERQGFLAEKHWNAPLFKTLDPSQNRVIRESDCRRWSWMTPCEEDTRRRDLIESSIRCTAEGCFSCWLRSKQLLKLLCFVRNVLTMINRQQTNPASWSQETLKTNSCLQKQFNCVKSFSLAQEEIFDVVCFYCFRLHSSLNFCVLSSVPNIHKCIFAS